MKLVSCVINLESLFYYLVKNPPPDEKILRFGQAGYLRNTLVTDKALYFKRSWLAKMSARFDAAKASRHPWGDVVRLRIKSPFWTVFLGLAGVEVEFNDGQTAVFTDRDMDGWFEYGAAYHARVESAPGWLNRRDVFEYRRVIGPVVTLMLALPIFFVIVGMILIHLKLILSSG